MVKREIARNFGAIIRRLRLEQELSQEEFAEACGLHRTYVGSIERGEKTVTIETARRLAIGLGITLSALFHELDAQIAESQAND